MSKTVLITGASSGIGLQCAKQFLNRNWEVISFDLNLCPLKDVESYIVDIRSEKEIKLAIQSIKELDVLVNNAAVYELDSLQKADSEVVNNIIDTNLKGSYLITKNLLHLIRKNRGSVIFVSSNVSVNATANSPIYSATKAGINMLAKCLAISESANGVKVNTVLPGLTDTPLVRNQFANEAEFNNYLKQNPNKKLLTPNEVANSVLYLAGALNDSNPSVVGAFLTVDGGGSDTTNLPTKKSDISNVDLEDRVNNYITKTMLDFNNIAYPKFKLDTLSSDVISRLCAKKWCHIAQTDAAKEYTKQKVEHIVKNNLPFIFSFCFGGYKHWWSPTSPVPDWAELYNMKYLYEYVAPITAMWNSGVTLEYESEEVGIELMNNVPDSYQKQYTKVFKDLMSYVKSKIKLPLNFNFVLASQLYDKNQLFKMMDEYFPVVKKRFDNLTPQEKAIRIKRAQTNILWKGAKDLTKLSEVEKANYAKESRIKNEAFLDMDYELRGSTYFEKENLIPLVGTFGLGAGGEGWLHLSSNSSSFVDFWSGIGILEVRDDKIIEKIISRSQFETIKDKLVKVKVNVPELAKIHENFTWIYVYEGELYI